MIPYILREQTYFYLADDETTTAITTTKQDQNIFGWRSSLNNHLETTQNTIVNKQRHSNKKPP